MIGHSARTSRLRWILSHWFRILVLLALGCCGLPVLVFLVVLVFWTVPIFGGRSLLAPPVQPVRNLAYFHDEVRAVPWSMHVVKVSRSRKDLELHSTMGKGNILGMANVSEQVRLLPREWGRPLAAVNGDLFNTHPHYPGDPEGLQIAHGELVSAPSATRACFWVDAVGNPHRGKVQSRFTATWPDSSSSPIGLNQARSSNTVVLYTPAVGSSTRTTGGLELLLEGEGPNTAHPLQIGRTYDMRVRLVSRAGNMPVTPGMMVLSLGPAARGCPTNIQAGASVRISTVTSPDLARSQTAIGGGPSLVAEGRAGEWKGLNLRHPRTAIGWNKDHFFLVEVDGRQFGLSAGMTLPELAEYMVKLGCQEAINLDGGGSATCWLYGNVMNSPSRGHERPAANALVLLQKSSRGADAQSTDRPAAYPAQQH